MEAHPGLQSPKRNEYKLRASESCTRPSKGVHTRPVMGRETRSGNRRAPTHPGSGNGRGSCRSGCLVGKVIIILHSLTLCSCTGCRRISLVAGFTCQWRSGQSNILPMQKNRSHTRSNIALTNMLNKTKCITLISKHTNR